ncbi:uncharacterized protein BJ171DRAFT_612718 [Polychytrium aggregatum]|uniref:uncharacterized protein n=1 Tax=Polychytrium aggregatum TaxID=110093 RepID=UPI0022FEEE68|nr:uncharacterized protein BJ171DRAFT_612718 [Polychytrium aggregatum]KAI9206126.1 hypothetical protein BJ171DRAFT_612718 [Polychytrium aggregatum]
MFSGGKDQMIKLWSIDSSNFSAAQAQSMDISGTHAGSGLAVELVASVQMPNGSPCHLCYNPRHGTLCAASDIKGIFFFRVEDTFVESRRHSQDEDHIKEITDLSCHSGLNLFATSSLDGMVKIWDGCESSLLREIQFGEPIYSVCFCNQRGDLLVGMSDQIALIRIQDYLPLQVLKSLLEAGEWIDDIIEAPTKFDSNLDFWSLYRDELEKKGEEIQWHVERNRTTIRPELQLEPTPEKAKMYRTRRIFLQKERHNYEKARDWENTTIYTQAAFADFDPSNIEAVWGRGKLPLPKIPGEDDGDAGDDDAQSLEDIDISEGRKILDNYIRYSKLPPVRLADIFEELARPGSPPPSYQIKKKKVDSKDDLRNIEIGKLRSQRWLEEQQYMMKSLNSLKMEAVDALPGSAKKQSWMLKKAQGLQMTAEDVMKRMQEVQPPKRAFDDPRYRSKRPNLGKHLQQMGILPNSVVAASAGSVKKAHERQKREADDKSKSEALAQRQAAVKNARIIKRAQLRQQAPDSSRLEASSDSEEEEPPKVKPKPREAAILVEKPAPIKAATPPKPPALVIEKTEPVQADVTILPITESQQRHAPEKSEVETFELSTAPETPEPTDIFITEALPVESVASTPIAPEYLGTSELREKTGNVIHPVLHKRKVESPKTNQEPKATGRRPLVYGTTAAAQAIPTLNIPEIRTEEDSDSWSGTDSEGSERDSDGEIFSLPLRPIKPTEAQKIASKFSWDLFYKASGKPGASSTPKGSSLNIRAPREPYNRRRLAVELSTNKLNSSKISLVQPEPQLTELQTISKYHWFPGLDDKPLTLMNIIEVLFKVLKTGYWREKCEASKALLYLYRTFQKDILDPLNSLIIPQLEFTDDENWQVRAAVTSNVIQYQIYNLDIIATLICRLNDKSDVVRKIAQQGLESFGIDSKESLMNMMRQLNMLRPIAKNREPDWLEILLERLDAQYYCHVEESKVETRGWVRRVSNSNTMVITDAERPASVVATLVFDSIPTSRSRNNSASRHD